ncbi:MAG: hypothetical protein C0631_10690 [Sedimenticola sp.]|jgi:hypothetical protein|nr:MAG: hypothetical protein C0631_10690 [Sedimenticola sp.]
MYREKGQHHEQEDGSSQQAKYSARIKAGDENRMGLVPGDGQTGQTHDHGKKGNWKMLKTESRGHGAHLRRIE